jgi:putative spermidine/putrescine transport system substrate-binding protein
MRVFSHGRRAAALALVALTCASLSACGGDDGEEEQGAGGDVTLTIAGWGGVTGDATQQAFLDPFEADSGVGWRMVDAPGTQLARVEAQNKAGEIEWDAMDPAGDAAFTLYRRGLLAKLPADLKAQLEQELGADRVTPFGFSHGNAAEIIVCNMDKMDVCPQDIAEFYDVERFPQSRTFPAIGPIQAVTTAQVAAGAPRAETADSDVDVDSAFEQLDRIKPKIRVFWDSGDQSEQVMRSGAVDMALMWANRAHRLRESGMNLEINWSGGVYDPSYWTVLEDAPHKQEAFDLLAWIATHPSAQAKWARAAHSSVAHPEAIATLPKSLATELADTPANFEQLAVPNFDWYSKNTKELDARYQDFVRGG